MVRRNGLSCITSILTLVLMILAAGYLTAYGTDPNGPDIVKTRCYTDSTKGTEIPHGTWTNDNTLYFEWTDPNSPSGDTFYYELNHSSGNTIGFSDEANTTVNHVEITLPSESDNWWFHVAAKNGAGTEGPQGKPRKILIKYDHTAPSGPSVALADPPINTPTNNSSVDLTWNEGTDTDGSGVDGYSWVVDEVPDTMPDQTLEGAGLPSTITLGGDDGDYYIHVRTKDNAGNWTNAYHYGPWKLDTTPPAVDITTPSDSAVIDGPVTIDADIIDNHPDRVSVKIDGGEVATSLPYTWDTTIASDGSHTLTVEATDKAGNVGADSITVTVDNHPTANFSAAPTSGDEPLAVSFTDHSSSVHSIASWSWDFGDGSTSSEQNPTHVYRQQGTYTVRLTVTEADDDGDADTEIKTDYITVGDTGPTALLSGDTNINEGAAAHYDASDSIGYDAPLTYEWDWNCDGTTFTPSGDTGATQNHAWSDNGTYTVAVRVTDSDGSTDIATLNVTVNNVAPNVSCPEDQTVNEGTLLTGLQVTFTDPGADTHTATLNWGDGTTDDLGSVTNPFTLPNHVYPNSFAGPFHVYTVTVTVTDDDGDTGTDNFDVMVNDVGAPTTTLSATPPNPDNTSSPYFEWVGTDNHSQSENLVYSYRVDGGAWSGWSAPGVNHVILTALTEGAHTFEVRAKDEAGNIGVPSRYTWLLDLTGPVVTITVPEDGAEYNLNSTIRSHWAAVDTLSGLATTTGTAALGGEIDTATPGFHNFTVTATDLAGNTTTKTVTYRVVYTVLPGGAAGGGGVSGEGNASFLEKASAGGGGAIGIAPLEAIYTIGEIIHSSFSLTDADGNNITDALVNCTLVKVTLGEEETRELYEILNLWPFAYDEESGLYLLDIETEELTPGIYDLWLGFDDGTQKRLRIQLVPEEESKK